MQVSIISTSDVHGYFRADDFRRPLQNDGLGLTRAATVIETLREQAAPEDVIITIENGDFIQGSPLTNYIEKVDQSAVSLYDDLAETIGYDVRILGNHEFNYGRDYLERVLGQNDLLLNANVLEETSGEPFIGRPYTIIERGGVKVGVIGLITKYVPNWEQPANIHGLTFADPVEVATRYADELRPQVDVLVLAYHGGFAEDLETGEPLERLTGENQGYQLLQIPGVDAVVTGHQHRTLAAVINHVATTQPGYRADQVGLMTLTLNDERQITNRDAQLIATAVFPENDAVKAVVEPVHVATNHWLDTAVGHVGHNMQVTNHFEARLHSHQFIALVNQVQMDVTQTTIANTALFNNEVKGLADEVTLRDIMTNYIYPNTLVVEKLTGQDIKDALEVNARYFVLDDNGQPTVNPAFLEPKVEHYNYDVWSGIDYTFDLRRREGERVIEVLVDGEPIDLAGEYEVAMNNYRAGGAGNFASFSLDKVVREVQRETADLIGDYIMSHPDIKIDQPTNFHVIY